MNIRQALVLAAALVAATQARAQDATPAWQESGYVMDEIVVVLSHAGPAPIVWVDEIVVTLSREEQARIRVEQLIRDSEIDLAAEAGGPTIHF